MRTEWAEGRARVQHWWEETRLRPEEMRRSTVSLLHEAAVWDSRKGCRTEGTTLAIERGLDAYASRQSATYEGLARAFYDIWAPLTKTYDLEVDWPAELLAQSSTRHIRDVVDVAALRAIPAMLSSTEKANEEDGMGSGMSSFAFALKTIADHCTWIQMVQVNRGLMGLTAGTWLTPMTRKSIPMYSTPLTTRAISTSNASYSRYICIYFGFIMTSYK